MVPDYSVIAAQIPGGDPAQFHGEFLDQPLVTRCGESDSVSRVTSELFISTDSCQHDLQQQERVSTAATRNLSAATFSTNMNYRYFDCIISNF